MYSHCTVVSPTIHDIWSHVWSAIVLAVNTIFYRGNGFKLVVMLTVSIMVQQPSLFLANLQCVLDTCITGITNEF